VVLLSNFHQLTDVVGLQVDSFVSGHGVEMYLL
jgi:hypothetical protein